MPVLVPDTLFKDKVSGTRGGLIDLKRATLYDAFKWKTL